MRMAAGIQQARHVLVIAHAGGLGAGEPEQHDLGGGRGERLLSGLAPGPPQEQDFSWRFVVLVERWTAVVPDGHMLRI